MNSNKKLIILLCVCENKDTPLVEIEIKDLTLVCLRIDLKLVFDSFEIDSETHSCEIFDLNVHVWGIL